MPNPKIYETELARFRKKYNMPEYDLNNVVAIDQKFQYLGSFLNKDTVENKPAAQFINWMSRTLGMCFEANTNVKANGKYIFYPQEFLRDFEKLASAKYHSELKDGEEPQRKKYAGASRRDLKQVLLNNFDELNKTLPTLWLERLKKGSMDLDNMQAITDKSNLELMANAAFNREKMNNHLTNVVAAHEAMKQLRESRKGFWGWLWKFFNGERNEKEEAYFEKLKTQVSTLKIVKYDVDGKIKEISDTTVLGLEVEKEKVPADPEVNPAKQAFQPMKVEPCAEKISNAYPETSKKVIKEILEKLPVTNKYGGLFREQTLEVMFVQVFNRFNELNEQFDKDMPTGNQKDAVAKLVRESFKVAQSVSVMATSGCDVDKVDACAMIAKLFIDNFTAVSIYPELGDVVNEYIKDNTALYREIESKELSYGKEIDNYAVDYVPSEEYRKEHVFNDKDNPFVEGNANKSAPIPQQPQINAPSLDK